MNSLIKLENAGVYKSSKWLGRGVSLELYNGQIVTLIGPNGSGKTTTAKMILKIFTADEGIVTSNTHNMAYVPQKIDIDYINFIGKNNLPLNLIFTKSDKVKKSDVKKNIDEFTFTLSEFWSSIPNYFISSSIKETGKEEILQHIIEINKSL